MRSVALVLLVAGCAHQHSYVPAAVTLAQVSGQTAAVYGVPPEAPTGEVRIASFGVRLMRLPGDGNAPALHVRMVITNPAGPPWRVDSREQLCEIAGEGRSRPLYANADGDGLPVLTVPGGAARTLDLFYPLPAGVERARQLPEFSILWNLEADGREVAMRTAFDRVTVEEEVYAEGYYGPAFWGQYGWYDPAYFEFRFLHPFPLPLFLPGPRIVVRPGGPPPHRWWPHPPVVGPRPPVIVRPPHRHR